MAKQNYKLADRTEDEQPLVIYNIGMYRALREQIRERREIQMRQRNQASRAVILGFPSGEIVYEDETQSYQAQPQTQPQFQPASRGLNKLLNELAESCARMDPIAGEEEYLARISEEDQAVGF